MSATIAYSLTPHVLLTYSEASNYLDLSIRQLERAVARGALSFYRINGRNIRFSHEQLDEFLEASLVAKAIA